MNPFFKQISELLKDKQEVKLNVQKIGEDLVVLTSIELAGEEKHITMSGTPEELDQLYLTELVKPVSVQSTFQSNAAEVADEVKVDLEEERKSAKADKKKEEKAKPAKSAKVKPGKTSKAETAPEPNSTGPGEVEAETLTVSEETEPSSEVKEEEPIAEVPKGPTPQEDFDSYMKEGKARFDSRDYEGAAGTYEQAVKLFPDNAKAKAALENAKRWAKTIADMRKMEEETKAIESL